MRAGRCFNVSLIANHILAKYTLDRTGIHQCHCEGILSRKLPPPDCFISQCFCLSISCSSLPAEEPTVLKQINSAQVFPRLSLVNDVQVMPFSEMDCGRNYNYTSTRAKQHILCQARRGIKASPRSAVRILQRYALGAAAASALLSELVSC
jgi:hypothetical protein